MTLPPNEATGPAGVPPYPLPPAPPYAQPMAPSVASPPGSPYPLTAPPYAPPRRRGLSVAAIVLLIASAVFFVLTFVVLGVVATVAENAASDSDRQMYGFFTVVAVIPCALSIVLLLVGILVAVLGRRR